MGRIFTWDEISNLRVPRTLDFQKVAAAFNLPYFNIQNYEEIDSKISEIISQPGPAFIEVVCDNKQKIIKPLKIETI